MILQRFTSIIGGLALVLIATSVQAGNPNYGQVLSHAQEAKSSCVQALPITFSVPNTYQSLRAGIYNRFDYMRSLSDKIATLTPQGNTARAQMLAYATSLKNEAKVVEGLIAQLKQKADSNNDHATENKARDLDHLVDRVECQAHILMNQLD